MPAAFAPLDSRNRPIVYVEADPVASGDHPEEGLDHPPMGDDDRVLRSLHLLAQSCENPFSLGLEQKVFAGCGAGRIARECSTRQVVGDSKGRFGEIRPNLFLYSQGIRQIRGRLAGPLERAHHEADRPPALDLTKISRPFRERLRLPVPKLRQRAVEVLVSSKLPRSLAMADQVKASQIRGLSRRSSTPERSADI